MNRKDPLERHLLTRCYDSESRIQELLSSRYSVSGDQKPSLVLLPTGMASDSNQPSLNTRLKTRSMDAIRKQKTRYVVRDYVKTTLNNQKKLVKKIQAHNRRYKNVDEAKRKTFPIKKMIEKYSIPQYSDFVAMNNMWQDYIQTLLFPNPDSSTLPGIGTMLPKLATADYHGCLLTVIDSSNKLLKGVRGIVVLDTQHTFILVVPQNEDAKDGNDHKTSFSPTEQVGGLRAIAKKGSLFGFDALIPKDNEEECLGFTIAGTRFEFRSPDRAARKFKNHKVNDLI